VFDSGGFVYLNPNMFPQAFAQAIDVAQAKVMAAAQKPFNQSILAEKSGPPAWKQLPTWYQISENDHAIPHDVNECLQNKSMPLLSQFHLVMHHLCPIQTRLPS
jgi:hypothetical protein